MASAVALKTLRLVIWPYVTQAESLELLMRYSAVSVGYGR